MSEQERADDFAALMKAYLENRPKVSPEWLLENYGGKLVAWGPDGKTIVASADDYETLDRLILDAGHDPARCICDYIGTESIL